ncbi:MAG: FAD-binding oxidoreductase [Eubacteriaceae bacterium]|uniref:FAD-binding oxidoreductase n=1 Tax=Candidatus Pseudoramibacter fermentans TaxID=2594427 RepID=A0A6L5GQL0_9FIRM|nr:FAD-binding oxidoreductase [Candidatus Pseudoramibacter fermentans]RRF92035.1 MAG: FAD-binding oxidoreductase [Eubacteriaceae bacterium]
MKKENIKEFLKQLKAQCPDVEIVQEKEERLIYAHGCYPVEYKWILQGPYKYLPLAIVRPNSTQDVSIIMALSDRYDISVIPYGGGSGIVGGTIPDHEEIMIDMKKLRSFEINPIDCTATGGAGWTGAEFENMLNEHGFTSGHYPQSFQSAVLGGMVSTRAIGTFSTKYGKMDDMVNSLEVVLPNGHIVQTHRTPKASTGPELDQLFLGAEGVYGLVTKVEMKIYPMAEKRYFEAYTFSKTEDALEAIRQFVQNGVHPAVVRVYDEEEAIPKIEKYGYEPGQVFVVFGYEGLKEIVDLEVKLVKRYAEASNGVCRGPKPGNDWFKTRFSTKKMLDYDAIKGGTADAIEVAAPWDSIVNVWREMRKALEPLCESVDCHFSHVYHTGASVYVIFHAKTNGDDFDGEKRYRECLDTAIRTSVANGGNVSHHHGSGKAKAKYLVLEHGEGGIEVMQKIKDALDPKGLVNKGVLGL